MTILDTAASDRASGLAARTLTTAQGLLAAALRAYKLRTCRRMLQELPDEILKDIGISRSDIGAVAKLVVDRQIDDTRRSARFGAR